MSLPITLLNAVASHPCITGCYRDDHTIHICSDPALPLSLTLQVACSDCLSFRVGAVASALPQGMSGPALADELSEHVRSVRGYTWARSGYFPGGNFWMSAAYYGSGLFLVDASRNTNQLTDLDVLINAFRLGIATPEHPRMLIPQLYTSELVYLNMASPIAPVYSKQDLLVSHQCRATPAPGYHRATILEFVPLVRRSAMPGSGLLFAAQAAQATRVAQIASPAVRPNVAPAVPATPAKDEGKPSPCAWCGAEIKERPLFSGTFVGCLC
jgi:hypothetical protein